MIHGTFCCTTITVAGNIQCFVCDNYNDDISYVSVALHPDPVQALSVTVDENVTLSWNPPVNIQSAEEVSEYQIRFKPHGGEHYNEMTVRDSCTATIDFTQESGLVSSKNYKFEVRAQNDCGEGEWAKASAFCGMYLYAHHDQVSQL